MSEQNDNLGLTRRDFFLGTAAVFEGDAAAMPNDVIKCIFERENKRLGI